MHHLDRLIRLNQRNCLRKSGERGDDTAMHHEPEKAGTQDEQCQCSYQPTLKIRECGKGNSCRTLHDDSPTFLRYRDVTVEPIAGLTVCDEIAGLSLKRIASCKCETVIVFR